MPNDRDVRWVYYLLVSSSLAVNNRISEIDKKLGMLLDGYVNQVISEEEYKQKKTSLLSERMTLKEKQAKIDGKGKIWLELARTIVTSAGQASYIAREGSFEEKRKIRSYLGTHHLFLFLSSRLLWF